MYLLNQAVITQAISAFDYQLTSFPYDATPNWAYSLTQVSGPTLVSTVESATGSNLLVGSVTDINAGTTTGPITSTAQVGTAVFTLTGSLTGSIAGITIPVNSKSTNFNVHIVEISLVV